MCVFSWSRFENSRGISLFNQRCRFLNCIPWRSFFFDKPKALKALHLPNFSFQTTNLEFSFSTLFYVLLLFPFSSFILLWVKKKKEIKIPFSQKRLKERSTIKRSIFTFFFSFLICRKCGFENFYIHKFPILWQQRTIENKNVSLFYFTQLYLVLLRSSRFSFARLGSDRFNSA